jgi:NAD(P)-dependent dehydrogenase (short-subunit alcohol dehydrogenase family)
MITDFNNTNVLITGGSRGIGRACAQLFASLHANVIITYKSNREEAEKTLSILEGNRYHKMFQLDIAQGDSIEGFFNEVMKSYDSLDVLVNNAGIYKEHKINEISYNEWQQAWQETMNTNLVGVSNLCYFAARQMIRQNKGKIVNISSRGAFRGEPNHPAYGASKAGLNAMSQSLAVALAPHNITVGVIAPGYVETDMVTAYLNSEEGEAVKKQSPLNRVARPEEVARAVVMFASEGNEFMTGGIIDVNGASYLRS